jgi:acyl-coenzyme A synthetase/AMP-(fatty) acid ligase
MRRIFSLGTGYNASTTPSVFVPDGGVGAHALRLMAGSEDEGPDGVFWIYSKILFAKWKYYFVIFLLIWILPVIWYLYLINRAASRPFGAILI